MTRPTLLFSGPKRPLRAVTYSRVSDDKAGGKSVREQDKDNLATVTLNTWDHVGSYSDNDKSANEKSKDYREDWERMVDDLERGLFDIIVIWEPSRATRDQIVWHTLAAKCVEHGVVICAGHIIYDPADPDQRMMLDIFFALARREAAYTAKRVRRGVVDRAEEGAPPPGKAPFGYRRTYKTTARSKLVDKQLPDTDKIFDVINNGEHEKWSSSDIVRFLFDQAAKGEPVYALAKFLNQMGIPNPRTIHALKAHPDRERKYASDWNHRVIRTMLKNPAYLGSRYHLGILKAEEKWDPLAKPEQFNLLRLQTAERTLKSARPAAQRRLLSGVMHCPTCNRPAETSSVARVPTYRCLHGHFTVDINLADSIVTTWLLSWLSVEENREEIRLASGAEQDIEAARAEYFALKAELAEWEAAIAAETVSLPAFQNFYKVHKPKLDTAERRFKVTGVPPALRDLVEADEPILAWEDMTLTAKRNAIKTLVTVTPTRVGRGQRHESDAVRVSIERKPLPVAA